MSEEEKISQEQLTHEAQAKSATETTDEHDHQLQKNQE